MKAATTGLPLTAEQSRRVRASASTVTPGEGKSATTAACTPGTRSARRTVSASRGSARDCPSSSASASSRATTVQALLRRPVRERAAARASCPRPRPGRPRAAAGGHDLRDVHQLVVGLHPDDARLSEHARRPAPRAAPRWSRTACVGAAPAGPLTSTSPRSGLRAREPAGDAGELARVAERSPGTAQPTSVAGSSCQYCSASLPDTSARLPAETKRRQAQPAAARRRDRSDPQRAGLAEQAQAAAPGASPGPARR